MAIVRLGSKRGTDKGLSVSQHLYLPAGYSRKQASCWQVRKAGLGGGGLVVSQGTGPWI